MNNGLTTCKACGEPLFQLSVGHRRREYCNDNCKQAAYRRRQEEKRKAQARQRWAGYAAQTQNQLEWLMNKYGCDFAKMVAGLIDGEREEATQGLIANEVLQARASRLEQHLVRYRQLIDLADICPWTALTPLQEYLCDHDGETISFRRQGRTIGVAAIDNHARAVSDRHGLITARLHQGFLLWLLKAYTCPGETIAEPMAGIGSPSWPQLTGAMSLPARSSLADWKSCAPTQPLSRNKLPSLRAPWISAKQMRGSREGMPLIIFCFRRPAGKHNHKILPALIEMRKTHASHRL